MSTTPQRPGREHRVFTLHGLMGVCQDSPLLSQQEILDAVGDLRGLVVVRGLLPATVVGLSLQGRKNGTTIPKTEWTD